MASPIVTNTSAQLSGGSLIVGFQTVLTNAQIKALPVTPISCVPAPGSGFRLKPIAASFQLYATAGAYTNVNTSSAYLVLSHTDATGDWIALGPFNDSTQATPVTALTDFFAAADYTYDLIVPATSIVSPGATSGARGLALDLSPTITVAGVENLALFLAFYNNGSGALTGGNAANAARITIYVAYEAV